MINQVQLKNLNKSKKETAELRINGQTKKRRVYCEPTHKFLLQGRSWNTFLWGANQNYKKTTRGAVDQRKRSSLFLGQNI